MLSIKTGSDSPVLCVPQEAVIEERGRCFVFVPVGEAYRMVPVGTGGRDAAWVEIVEGLADGDEVVVGGSYGLYSMFKQGSANGVQH